MNTATKISTLHRPRGDAAVYKIDPPMEYGDDQLTDYVVVSAVDVALGGPETYIFPAKVGGQIKSWVKLDGSFNGGLDHETALANAGYTVVIAHE